jgi:Phage integrase family
MVSTIHDHTEPPDSQTLYLSAMAAVTGYPETAAIDSGILSADAEIRLQYSGGCPAVRCSEELAGPKYGLETGLSAEVMGLCVHSLRATAATNALSHDSDIAKVQEWLGHTNVSTTRLYDRRKRKPEDSPTFRVKY